MGTTFWCYDDGGGGGMPLSFDQADAIAEMNHLHPNWQSAESMWNLVEVNGNASMQRFWYNDREPTAWGAF